MTGAREQILSAVRRATDAGPATDEAVAPRLAALAPNLRPARGADDASVASRFTSEAGRAGTDLRHAAHAHEIPAIVAAYLREQNMPGDIRVSGGALSAAIPWAEEPVLSVTTGAAEPGDTASLSIALCAIAETGTLMMTSSPENPTLLNYLPFVHIAVVPEDRIVGSLETAWSILRDQSGMHDQSASENRHMPRMINLITGPSRTADIEQELLMGAHGPQKHMIIILKQA